MNFKELTNKSEAELKKMLSEERENFRAVRFSVGAKQQKNIRELRGIKKLIARISTLLTVKKSGLMPEVKSEEVKPESK